MKKKDIVLIGGGGHAKVVFNTLVRLNSWNIIGYTDFKDSEIRSLEYLGTDEVLKDIVKTVRTAVIAVGQIKSYKPRYNLYIKIKELGFSLPPITAKSAVIMQNVSIGDGTYIGEQVYVGPDVKIGVMDIINTGSIVEHDSQIGDFVHLSINSTLAGNTRVGNGTFIGMGANVSNGITIGENVTVAAGTIVRKYTESRSLIYGNPARIIKNYNKTIIM